MKFEQIHVLTSLTVLTIMQQRRAPLKGSADDKKRFFDYDGFMQKKNSNTDTFYLVHYRDPQDGKVVALKVKKIEDSQLGLGFVKLSDFIFDTRSLVVQPVEEQLKQRFENVKSFHLSIYSLVSVEELGVKHKGLNFKKDRSNLISFPSDQPPQA
jgi:hypothetical protein